MKFRRYGQIPENRAAIEKRVAAKVHPVNLAPATPPAKKPASTAWRQEVSTRLFERSSIAEQTKTPIHMSGDPEALSCQKTSGVTRNAAVKTSASSLVVQRTAKQNTESANNAPP